MKIGNVNIRENGHKVNLFLKVEKIKRDLNVIIPEIEDDKLLPILSHCRRHYEGCLHYGRRKSQNNKPRNLTPTERLVYDHLLKEKLNPSTMYRWFLATRLPEDVKEKLAKGLLSYKLAMRIAWNRKKATETNQGILLIEELRSVIRRL